MNKSKFSLADLLTVLAALAFGFVCFLGTNFFTLGNTNQSIILSMIIAVLLGGTAFLAKLLKRTSRNFKICFVWEIILLVLFTAFAVFFSWSPFPHYFNVSAKKTEIQNKLQASITQAENMFAEYESYADIREYLYELKLKSIADAKNINPSEYAEYFENNGVTDEKQIKNKIFILHADLFPTNYSDTTANNGIKEVATEWLANAKNITNSWKPIGIVSVVNEVEQNSTDWLNTLINLSKVREKGEQTIDFEYSLSFDDVKTDFKTLGKPTGLTIGLSALTYVLMLLSWFVTKRDSRSTGSLTTAPYEVVL
jgi:energy-coupling factor transporter transmembrane protein EcfT